MYDSQPAKTLRLIAAALAVAVLSSGSLFAQILQQDPAMIRKISGPTEKLEITTNTSRILTLETRIPRVQVNNPELLSVTPLSATQIQISAKKAGVTAVNLWDEDGNIHTVDVFIYGDVRELEHALKTQFPNSSVRVYRYSNSLVLAGFIDRPDYVTPIVELAQDYSPKIINNMNVGGVQQVLLKVKIYEISRTKARALGVDFSQIGGSGGFFISKPQGLVSGGAGGSTVEFGIVSGDNGFFGLLDALQENSAAKILAEPNLVAVSGRPALFNEGGEIPILVPQSLGTSTIEYKKFGTQVDFLPIVLGNGNIRLEVRPRISAIDPANSITLNGIDVPGLKVREVDTAVEMKAGQTFALAGLIQRQTESVNSGIPILASIPGIGIPFRRTEEKVNEIELLIMVTPEFVDALNPEEVPPCYPGSGTMSPTDKELYWGGQIEVPNMCSPCGGYPCVPTHGHEPCCPGGNFGPGAGAGGCGGGQCGGGYGVPANGGYGTSTNGGYYESQPYESSGMEGYAPVPLELPTPAEPQGSGTNGLEPGTRHGELVLPPSGGSGAGGPADRVQGPSLDGQGRPLSELSRRATPHYTASRNPQYQRQPSEPFNPQRAPRPVPSSVGESGLIGPVGYDLE